MYVFNVPNIIASTSVYHFSIMQTLLEQELSKIVDGAACKYNKDTSIEDHIPKGIEEALQAACCKPLKQLLSKFVKCVCVAKPALDDDFLLHIRLH